MRSLDDMAYRQKLLNSGVSPYILGMILNNQLDNLGNLIQVYRTSMEEQDPAAFAIETFKRRWWGG